MNKIIISVVLFLCIGVSFVIAKTFVKLNTEIQYYIKRNDQTISTTDEKNISDNKKTNEEVNKKYAVYQNGVLIKYFDIFDEAYNFASNWDYTSIKNLENDEWIWDNTPLFNVYTNTNKKFISYNLITDALKYARVQKKAFVYSIKTNSLVWTNLEPLEQKYIIEDVPLIQQKPELPRGCEVTSLAMLLNHAGVEVDKMELAAKIKKDETPLEYKNGQIYYGDPNNGFIGSMYDLKANGLGVYHKPIAQLAEQYLPDKILDLTGLEFEDILYFINQSLPVWIITNSSYTELPSDKFETWITPNGAIDVTYSEHSVVITGYDDEYIYFNDPLFSGVNRKALRDNFIKAWIQMGRQAITYLK